MAAVTTVRLKERGSPGERQAETTAGQSVGRGDPWSEKFNLILLIPSNLLQIGLRQPEAEVQRRI